MYLRTRLVAIRTLGRLIGPGVFSLQILLIAVPLIAQDQSHPISSEIRHIGTAEMRSVTKTSGFFPDRQPAVYWHDEDWKIDLLPLPSLDDAYSLSIASSNGKTQIVKLPDYYSQIESISVAPGNKAIIIEDATGTAQSFGILDLKQGKLIDDIGMEDPSISPNRRFILYVNGYPAHGLGEPAQYHIYDTLKTPRENTCGYRLNDPQHKDLDEDYRGIQVYPRKGDQVSCSDADLKAFEDDDHNLVSNFVWSDDSSKAVFADVMNENAMSLILVTMPKGENDADGVGDRDNDRGMDNNGPRTFVYPLVGAENVCAAVGPLGKTGCDYNNVRSIAWDGNAVNAVLVQANPTGAAIVKNLTIPLSKFMPIGK